MSCSSGGGSVSTGCHMRCFCRPVRLLQKGAAEGCSALCSGRTRRRSCRAASAAGSGGDGGAPTALLPASHPSPSVAAIASGPLLSCREGWQCMLEGGSSAVLAAHARAAAPGAWLRSWTWSMTSSQYIEQQLEPSDASFRAPELAPCMESPAWRIVRHCVQLHCKLQVQGRQLAQEGG